MTEKGKGKGENQNHQMWLISSDITQGHWGEHRLKEVPGWQSGDYLELKEFSGMSKILCYVEGTKYFKLSFKN